MIVAGSALWIAAEWPRAADPQHGPRRVDALLRRAGTGTRPSTGHSFSCASGSSGTTSRNGASSTRVVPGTRMPASLGDPGRVAADEPGVEVAAGEYQVPHLVPLGGLQQVAALPA